ncbi:MbtH family protein [Streptomyces sp. NPDC046909]|uniref:MbtH family protein n=1 Tax=Streptomyces sp. NPDC046909 TaxID=3155617 RepID=UPI00340B78CC
MTTNPFEDESASYLVLANDESQHSLWPATTPVPAGWTQVHGPTTREAALHHIQPA